MYSFIRLLIGCIFLICSFVLIKRSKTVHKKALYIVFLCLSGILPTVLSFIPFENSFITFKSLDSAYHYVYGKSDIELVVEGYGYKNNPGMKKQYLLTLLNTSSRAIPKNQLTFLGNVGNIKRVDNEDLNSYNVNWKRFETYMIDNFKAWL